MSTTGYEEWNNKSFYEVFYENFSTCLILFGSFHAIMSTLFFSHAFTMNSYNTHHTHTHIFSDDSGKKLNCCFFVYWSVNNFSSDTHLVLYFYATVKLFIISNTLMDPHERKLHTTINTFIYSLDSVANKKVKLKQNSCEIKIND